MTVFICTTKAKEELQLRVGPILVRAPRFCFTGLLLVSILHFYAGPQFGSLDADGDGTPEVPIIVLSSSSGVVTAQVRAQAPNVSKDHRRSILSHIRSLLPVVLPNQYPKVERQPNSLLGHPTLLSLGLLRC